MTSTDSCGIFVMPIHDPDLHPPSSDFKLLWRIFRAYRTGSCLLAYFAYCPTGLDLLVDASDLLTAGARVCHPARFCISVKKTTLLSATRHRLLWTNLLPEHSCSWHGSAGPAISSGSSFMKKTLSVTRPWGSRTLLSFLLYKFLENHHCLLFLE